MRLEKTVILTQHQLINVYQADLACIQEYDTLESVPHSRTRGLHVAYVLSHVE
jgi:hypothetical protein